MSSDNLGPIDTGRPRCRSLPGVRILANGSYLPDTIVTNEELQSRIGCDPAWLLKQTGIRQRRHASPELASSDLGYEAAKRCLESIDFDPKRIDMLIVATVTPDMTFPATACIIANKLSLNCPAFDISAGCAGFLYALIQACSAISSGMAEHVLVIGSEVLSRIINPNDMKTYPLLGDGAGAALVGVGEPDQGMIRFSVGSDGSGGHLLCRKAGGTRQPITAETLQSGEHYLFMDGRAVFTWAVTILCDTIQDVLRDANLTPGDIDLYVPHQANIRIVNAALDVLGIPRSKVFTNLDRYGNTSAASVPICLDEAVREGRIKRGTRVMLSGFGAGLVWGTALWHW
jgi:3-oxoacyl-[acyl-carrier-protein] synthase-3